MASVEISTDTANRLKLIRNGAVYDSVKAVVSELLQNSQRAEATEIRCIIKDDTFSVEDNGKGCPDPEKLFKINVSQWDSTKEGFGEGFTSCYVVADVIDVHTCNWKSHLEIGHMIEIGNMNAKTQKAKKREGFYVCLKGKRIADNFDEISNFLRHSASLLPMPVYINDELITKKDFAKVEQQVQFTKTYDNSLFTAHLTPRSRWNNYVTFYYESREVVSEQVQGMSGNIILKKDACTLKAPDRKAIIRDAKRNRLFEEIYKIRKNMYQEIVGRLSTNLVKEFAEMIKDILPVHEYEDLLEVNDKLFKIKKVEEEPEEDKIAATLAQKRYEDHPETPDRLNIDVEIKSRKMEDKNETHGFAAPPSIPTETAELIKALGIRKSNVKLSDICKNSKVYWLRADDLLNCLDQIKQLQYYGFLPIIAETVLHEAVFQKYNTPYIASLLEDLKKVYDFKRIEVLNKKEQRLIGLLRNVEQHYKLGECFRIADIDMHMEFERGDKVIKSKNMEVMGCQQGRYVYLDRKSLDMASWRVDKWNADKTSLFDARFLMKNQDTIAHELAHLLYNTKDNTIQHFQATAKISRELGYLF